MAKLRSVLGYIVAALSILIMVAAVASFILLPDPSLSGPLIAATGLTTSPWYSGGEVARTVDNGAYQTQIHRPVFDALIGERKEGFIQVGWAPLDALPARIDKEIDADGDGQADFRVEVDTANKESTMTPYAPWVLDLEGTYRLNDTLAVRVRLRNPSR
jgi:hypothetical protein